MHWSVLSIVWFIVGWIIHGAGWEMNKQTWSPSYVCMMAGTTGFFSIFFYAMLDWQEWQPRALRAVGRMYAVGAATPARPVTPARPPAPRFSDEIGDSRCLQSL